MAPSIRWSVNTQITDIPDAMGTAYCTRRRRRTRHRLLFCLQSLPADRWRAVRQEQSICQFNNLYAIYSNDVVHVSPEGGKFHVAYNLRTGSEPIVQVMDIQYSGAAK
jgi:hypothetical protein